MTRQSYLKTIYGNCSFELIESYETAEKAANGKDGQFVEVKLNELNVEFSKVRKEDGENQTGTPETERQGTKKI